jgi:hypothetical protein
MAYADQARLIARIGDDRFLRLFDRDGDGVADAVTVMAALAYAEALIDSKLAVSHGGRRFDSPGPVPEMIAACAADLAIGWAGMAFPGSATETHPYAAPHKAALSLLDALAKDQQARLPGVVPEPARSSESYVDTGADPQWSGGGGF